MSRLYSPTTGNCYVKGLHAVIPADTIEISTEVFDLVVGSPSLGKIRMHGDDGVPYLIDPPFKPNGAEAAERTWRDNQVIATEWVVIRHRDQQDMQLATTLQIKQFAELLQYRQALRDWPQSELFPVSEHRPVPPLWLESITP